MDIKQIEKQIYDLQKDMKLSYRRTVDDAVKIGELLTDAKAQLPHGEFMPWCERQGIKKQSADRYQLLYDYREKFPNVGNLTEAYQLIESEENKKKRQEFEAQSKRIHEFKKTGSKPDDWDEKTDSYRLKKEKEDADYADRKREHFKEREKKFEENQQKDKQDTENLFTRVDAILEEGKKKQTILEKMRMTGNNSKDAIYDVLFDYLSALSSSTRLEACHNIIKFCKTMAGELQKESVRS